MGRGARTGTSGRPEYRGVTARQHPHLVLPLIALGLFSWLDWSRLSAYGDVFRFFQRMIAFRKAHPSIARVRYWREDGRWYGIGASADLSHDSHSLAYCLHGGTYGDSDLYVMINLYWETAEVPNPGGRPGDLAARRRNLPPEPV
jgi:pullulanase/glycogen debranching enzyme